MASALPTGPDRVRASDSDRDRITSFIRSNYEAGRLSDDELEQRLGKATKARTLGDLRQLIGDLPQPSTSPTQRAAKPAVYAGRAAHHGLRTKLGAVGGSIVGAFIILIIIGAALSGSDSDSDSTSSESTDNQPHKVTRVKEGGTGVDEGLAFKVQSVHLLRKVAQAPEEGGGQVDAGPHQRFVVANVKATNHADKPVDPFCASTGASLVVRGGQAFEPIDGLYRLAGNYSVICGGGMQPGTSAKLALVFRVPAGVQPKHLDLWNSDNDVTGDAFRGYSRVRVKL